MPTNRAPRIVTTAAIFLAVAQFVSAVELPTRAEALNVVTDKMSGLLWSTRQEHLEGLGLPIGDLERLVEELASKVAHCILESYLAQAEFQQIDAQGVLELLIGEESESRSKVEGSLDFGAVRERIRTCNEPIGREYGFALD